MIDEKRWQKMTFYQQMGNLASEISRAVRFKKQNDIKHMLLSVWRTLELMDLTIEDIKNKSRLRELCRFKEVLGDWYSQTHVYSINPQSLKNYSLNFAMLGIKQK